MRTNAGGHLGVRELQVGADRLDRHGTPGFLGPHWAELKHGLQNLGVTLIGIDEN
jgi:hypothetical protein